MTACPFKVVSLAFVLFAVGCEHDVIDPVPQDPTVVLPAGETLPKNARIHVSNDWAVPTRFDVVVGEESHSIDVEESAVYDLAAFSVEADVGDVVTVEFPESTRSWTVVDDDVEPPAFPAGAQLELDNPRLHSGCWTPWNVLQIPCGWVFDVSWPDVDDDDGFLQYVIEDDDGRRREAGTDSVAQGVHAQVACRTLIAVDIAGNESTLPTSCIDLE